MIDVEHRFQDAIQHFWDAREKQQQKQTEGGKIDAGSRGAVTGGTQMGALEVLVSDILIDAGLDQIDIKTRISLEIPGYYRPEKKWDLIVVSRGKLVTIIEFKSQVGPSFGNNFNNRSEEAIGSASDIWVAYREGRFGTIPPPFLGYFFLLEDCPAVNKPVRNQEPYFPVDPIFKGALNAKGKSEGISYGTRYEILCRRLVMERLYTAACLTFSANAKPATISHPASDLTFQRFVAALQGHVVTFLGSVR
jgi:hypothetical protein